MIKLPYLIFALAFLLPSNSLAQDNALDSILGAADAIEPLETVIVARDGIVLAEQGYDGHSPDDPTNIKSASKTVVAALVGMAIEKGILEGVDQHIAELLPEDVPDDADPRLAQVTIGNLLSMQAGLRPTSGANYGRWIASRNWVREALAQPFVAPPGSLMLYSTGSTHLLSAILTHAAGDSTLDLAEEWFAPLDDFGIGGWARDPQGIYLGGNQMAMSPRSLLAFGEVYRNGGVTRDGTRLLSEDWIEQSWTAQTRSLYTGDGYGYGWYLREIGGEDVRFAWGFGGQMLYIVPALDLTVVMTSDEELPSADNGHRDALHALLGTIIDAVRDDAAPSHATAQDPTSPTSPG